MQAAARTAPGARRSDTTRRRRLGRGEGGFRIPIRTQKPRRIPARLPSRANSSSAPEALRRGHRLRRSARIIRTRGREIPRAITTPAPIRHNPEVQIMDLMPNSGLDPVPYRLAAQLEKLSDLVDGQELVWHRLSLTEPRRPEDRGAASDSASVRAREARALRAPCGQTSGIVPSALPV